MSVQDAATKDGIRQKSTLFKVTMRPEIEAGGFARDDSNLNFYTRVNALLAPPMTVLDFGAGRGSGLLGEETYMKRLRRLQGKVTHVIGIDVDDAVERHPFLDERHVVAPGAPLPLADASVDIVVCDWVLEHVTEPEKLAAEMARILRPGGWFCARTPNRWGFAGIAINLVPNALHDRLLARVAPERFEEDTFPTVYKINTLGAIRKHFPHPAWRDSSYIFNSTPKYHANKAILFKLIEFYQNVVPKSLGTDLMVFVRKQGA